MAKKPAETFHLSKVAQSLEAQNNALLPVFMAIRSAMDLKDTFDTPEKLRLLIEGCGRAADKAYPLIWPGQD